MEFKIAENILHYYVDLLRDKSQQETGVALHNIIRLMRMSRNCKICNEDFSRLDFQNILLNGIQFSMDGFFSSHFNHSIIEKQSIYSGHYGRIFFAQFSDDGKYIITWGFDGQIVIWNIASQNIQKIIMAYDPINPDFDGFLIDGYPFYHLDILPPCFNIEEITKKYLNKYVTHKTISDIPGESNANLSIRKWLSQQDIHGGKLCFITDDSKYAIISYNNGSSDYRIIDYRNLRFISDCYLYIGILQKEDLYFAIDHSWNLKLFNISNNNQIMRIIPCKREICSLGISEDNTHCYSLCRNISAHISSSLIEWNLENGRIERRILCDSNTIDGDREIKNVLRSYSRRENTEYFGYEDDDWERYDGIILKASDKSFEIACVGYEGCDYSCFYFNDYKTNPPICVKESIKSVALNFDGSFFIYVTSTLEIVYWEIALQKEKKRVLARTSEDTYITSAELSLDGSLLIVGHSNGVINVIRSVNGELIHKFEHFSQLYVAGCDFSHAQMDNELHCLLQSYGGVFNATY